MIEIKLYTKDRKYVVTALVPDYDPKADVLVWGSRLFVLTDGAYIEGFGHIVLDTKG